MGVDNLKGRRILISLGLICNVLGLCLSIYVAFAISFDFDILTASAFTRGHINYVSNEFNEFEYDFRIGIRAVAVTNYTQKWGAEFECLDVTDDWSNLCVIERQVVPFDEFCDFLAHLSLFDDPDECDNCNSASRGIMGSLFVSIIMCFPSISTSVLRLYDNYDCNCQKVFGGFAAIISCLFAIYTFTLYQFRCFRSFGLEDFVFLALQNWKENPLMMQAWMDVKKDGKK